jgi:hypothetical protein
MDVVRMVVDTEAPWFKAVSDVTPSEGGIR